MVLAVEKQTQFAVGFFAGLMYNTAGPTPGCVVLCGIFVYRNVHLFTHLDTVPRPKTVGASNRAYVCIVTQR
jgi:hypothetical protein